MNNIFKITEPIKICLPLLNLFDKFYNFIFKFLFYYSNYLTWLYCYSFIYFES
jgi:hypothetical protein